MSDLDGPPVLFADLDGTVRHGKDELGHFVNTVHDVVIFPEVAERVREWRNGGGVVIGLTNQAGVALGHMTYHDHRSIMAETQARARLDHAIACTHAPDDGCWCRKPSPGLLYAAMAWLSDRPGTPRPPRRDACLMVGDRPEDEACAAAAGVPFQWATRWRAGA